MYISVNSTCPPCKKRFNASTKQIVICNPCGHFYHYDCVKLHDKCDILECDHIISGHTSEDDHVEGSQTAIDIMSLKRTQYNLGFLDYMRGLCRIPFLVYHLLIFSLQTPSYKVLQKMLANVNRTLNINVSVKGITNLNKEPKIYVLNHCSFLDALITPRIVTCGVIASISNVNNIFGKMMAKCTNVLFVTRGKSENMVQKVEEHVEKNGSILFCPQSIFSHIKTLPFFRTGAFATKYQVQPMMLLYKQNISSLSMLKILCYPRIDVMLKILPVTKREVNESVQEFAERTRRVMAQEGKLLLSNVSSRDIRD
jgi:1-acyl-sn-glycerol-3-phosphate acyltransferase